MSFLKDWLHPKKDACVSFLLEKAIQHRLAPYGRLRSFALDSREKTARLELLLHGEKDPVTVLVHRYELLSEPDQTWLVIHRLSISREWADRLAGEIVPGRRIPMPHQYNHLLRLLL